MPTTVNETAYPYERYVDGVLQISIDGHNWTDYLGRPLYSNLAQARLLYDQILDLLNTTKGSNLSPFQEWEKSING